MNSGFSASFFQQRVEVRAVKMQAYKKEKQIGQGAFGSAWLVKSKSGGTLVAKFVNMAGMPKAGEVLRLLA